MARKAIQITESDLKDAIRRFQAAGGLINKLPDQPEPMRNLVGARWGMYEPVMEGMQVQARATAPGLN